jgi:hypothetical protein
MISEWDIDGDALIYIETLECISYSKVLENRLVRAVVN